MLVHLPTNPDNTVDLAVYDFRDHGQRVIRVKTPWSAKGKIAQQRAINDLLMGNDRHGIYDPRPGHD